MSLQISVPFSVCTLDSINWCTFEEHLLLGLQFDHFPKLVDNSSQDTFTLIGTQLWSEKTFIIFNLISSVCMVTLALFKVKQYKVISATQHIFYYSAAIGPFLLLKFPTDPYLLLLIFKVTMSFLTVSHCLSNSLRRSSLNSFIFCQHFLQLSCLS